MKNKSRSFLTLVLLTLTAWSTSAFASSLGTALRMPALFSNNMVLQRHMKVPVWGWASPGAKIKVVFAGHVATAVASASGAWVTDLPPMPADIHPQTLVVSDGISHLNLTNVLVGEVWLCSGQINMTYTLGSGPPGGHMAKEISRANYPQIRLINVVNNTSARLRKNFQGMWNVCSPKTAGAFTAVGYYFARDIYRRLKVPIGLISSTSAGAAIQPWIPTFAFKNTPQLQWDYHWIVKTNADYARAKRLFMQRIAAWLPQARAAMASGQHIATPPPEPHNPMDIDYWVDTTAYNAMIHPLVPYALRGVLWYQGESNLGDPFYYYRLRALIAGWRQVWHEGNFPFYIVQIAPYNYGGTNPPQQEAQLWNAQEKVTRTVVNTGIVGTMDIGNLNTMTPSDKWDVGYRLSLWALAKTYGEKGIVYSGPVYKSVTMQGKTAVIHFRYTDGGLVSRHGGSLTWFEIAGSKHSFVPAQARIVGRTVVVQSRLVLHPVAVRFAWSDLAQPNLMNKAGLPALPFATAYAKGHGAGH